MQATPSLPTGFAPEASARINPRIATATGIVIGLHVIALAIAFTVRELPTVPVETQRTITAELLPPPAPAAAPVAIESAPPPPKPVPVQKVKPKVQPRPTPKPTPAPMPVAQAPSQHEISAPETAPAPPAPTAPVAPAAPAAPAAKPVMSITAPKDASHLNCSIVEPTYPAMSRRRGETGRAVVQFILSASGRIENVELKKSSGYDRLDQAALDAIRSSSCKPYVVDGEATRVPAVQPFDFSLNN
ncbi:energy transducer TonB [Paraburkholderia azotifigens]|uniref:Energy transducer TonB n=1 Tax=Paraburkholderia azotifigens TaxID=2057004 RepID=A0A5C6VUN8_9BURK|nr:energy transducer TonB [Paraburkholderia azotifigens]TXC89073.1 energy transducer TonB [Paraburkholderia azotifigens]